MTDGADKESVRSTDDGPGSEARKRFEAIVAEGEDGVVILEPKGVIGYANDAAEFLLGRGRTELLGEMFGLPVATSDEAIVVNVISRDDVVRLVELRIEPLASGPEGTLVLRLKDVTDYHRSVLEAREEVRQRDEFLAMLSHEIRNPLAAIRSAAILLGCDEVDSQSRRHASDVLDRQFVHLIRILDDLFDVTRIMRGSVTITPARVDLNRILRDAVDAVSQSANERRHEVRLKVPERTLWVNGDATRLEQIVVNLLNNAVKFTPPQGKIALSAQADGESVVVRVRDNGPGIPEELLPRIFEPFVQATQTLERSNGGLGIGLMLVRTFVALHGGRIDAQANEQGPGMTFTVHLPLEVDKAESTDRSVAESRAGRARILVVEDSEDARGMLSLLLRTKGHEVIEAANGPDGLAAVARCRPDIAFVDIGLPGMDGFELVRRLRSETKARLPRLVALTGYGSPEDVRRAHEAGFDEHMVKPVDVSVLWRLIEMCMQDGPSPRDSSSRESGQS